MLKNIITYICKYMLNLFVDFHFFDGGSEWVFWEGSELWAYA